MADIFQPAKRSYIMSRIKGKGTKPEAAVFSYLRTHKVYFKRHYSRVKGSPDIALPRRKKAVFIDGDFWHGYTLEKRKDSLPAYWVEKIIRNVKRDRRYRKELRAAGWKVMRVWEHELASRHRADTLESIRKFLAD